MPRHASPLTPKEAAFVDEYLIDGNGARAARAAGYAERQARRMAFELIRKPHVVKALKKAREDQQKRTLITADQVLRDLDRIATKAEGAGEFHAAIRGKELIGKHYKLFTEKHEHGGIGGGPVLFEITSKEADL